VPKLQFFFILGLLGGGAALATRGTPDPSVNLRSLTELWSDTLRDTDQIGMKFTRVSAAEEMRKGAELAGRFKASDQPISGEAYIGAVGQAVAEHVRRHEIRYQFHLVDSTAINAFALPGGQIFVTTGMLSFVDSEAELAAVLGHEISHVDLRHCIERYQYEITSGKAGVPEAGQSLELARRLATFSFTPDQELEADAQGQRMSIEAGYDPDAAAALCLRMQARLREQSLAPATTPVGEVTQSAGEAIGSFFRSHPPSQERARDLNDMVARHRTALHGQSFYIGKENLHERVSKSQREYPQEYRTL
jgi:beta-barrel assembly-enhancing protease